MDSLVQIVNLLLVVVQLLSQLVILGLRVAGFLGEELVLVHKFGVRSIDEQFHLPYSIL